MFVLFIIHVILANFNLCTTSGFREFFIAKMCSSAVTDRWAICRTFSINFNLQKGDKNEIATGKLQTGQVQMSLHK